MSKPVWSYTAAGARKPPTPCGGGNFPGALDAGLALAHPVGTCLLLTLLVSTVTGFLVEFAHGIQILPPTPIEDAELLVQVTLDSQGQLVKLMTSQKSKSEFRIVLWDDCHSSW